MKSFLGVLLSFLALLIFIGGGALIFYLSNTAEFSRQSAASPSPVPAAPATLER